jgi:hypothetical protein
MAIKFKCEHCGSHLKANEDSQDELLPCVRCRKDVKVPIIAGPCPSCGTLMVSRGCSWHLALFWAVLGGVFATLFFTAGIPFVGKSEYNIISRLIGIVIAVLTTIICIHFLRQRELVCSECSTSILGCKRMKWGERQSVDQCVLCGKNMTPWNTIYRLVALILAGIGLVPIILSVIYLITSGQRGVIFGGVIFVFIETYLFSNALQRFRVRAMRCPHCRVQTIIPSSNHTSD